MINIIIGIIIGSIITFIIVKKTAKKEPDYSKLIESEMKEADADLSNCGKNKFKQFKKLVGIYFM